MTTNIPLIPEKPTHKLTQSYLKSILSYDPETGVFTWKERQDVTQPAQWNGRFAGKQAGTKRKGGNTFYRRIRIGDKPYLTHRLAWFYMTGQWPPEQIDHVDGNGLNNRFENLRLATHGQNKANSGAYRTNKLGIRGVHRQGNRYIARIQISRRKIHLGSFDTPQEASAAYAKAAEKHFGEFARVN